AAARAGNKIELSLALSFFGPSVLRFGGRFAVREILEQTSHGPLRLLLLAQGQAGLDQRIENIRLPRVVPGHRQQRLSVCKRTLEILASQFQVKSQQPRV